MFIENVNSEHCTIEEFMEEFFGCFGRDFWDKERRMQYYVDNPETLLEYVQYNNKHRLPSFISVQPRKSYHKIKGIEKLSLDFDYYSNDVKNKINPDEKAIQKIIENGGNPDDGLREEALALKLINKRTKIKDKELLRTKILEKRRTELEFEVQSFIKYLTFNHFPIFNPMICKTMKGYHVHIYCDSVYDFGNDNELLKEVYNCLGDSLINSFQLYTGYKLKYLDLGVKQDVFRILRVPFSNHEGNGKPISLVKLTKNGFVEDKLRHLNYYKNSNFKKKDVEKAFEMACLNIKVKKEKLKKYNTRINYNSNNYYRNEVRKCFVEALKRGELNNQLRLALLLELYYAGKSVNEMIEMFSSLSDFSYDKTKYYVEYFLKHENYKMFRPYKCSTLKKYNLCLRNNSCPLYREGD